MKDTRIRYFAENLETLSRRDRVFLNNPVIMQGLGLAPIVIPANTLQNAFILAVAVLLLLTPTRVIATAIGQRVGVGLRAVTYALTAGVLYFAVAMAMDFLFGIGLTAVGIYLPLLVLEPLIIKRYESPKRERVFTSFKKGMITTAGFCLVLFLVAAVRELLALGTLGGIEFFSGAPLPFAGLPAGGFIIVGLLAALWRGLVRAFKGSIATEVKKLQ